MSCLNSIKVAFFASYNMISSSENEGQHGFSMDWLGFHVSLAYMKSSDFLFNSVIEASTWKNPRPGRRKWSIWFFMSVL